jgi:RNA polymerase sigma factor (sigma-70 family)
MSPELQTRRRLSGNYHAEVDLPFRFAMADRQGGMLVRLRKLLETHVAKELTDGQLLARFAAQHDETAFAALMQRHGPLVYGVCRRVLGHEHDAEDALQGTFLVLARKAKTIHRQSSVAGWLHGVAYRLSLKARQAAARRRRHESRAARSEADRPPSELAWRELQVILDEELQRLPDKYRTPFVLCALEGKTKPEAAQELAWKEGTVSSRLAKARKLLQLRLARRGVTLSAVLCGLAVTETSAEAAVPMALGGQTLEAAVSLGTGKTVVSSLASPGAVELANAVLHSMAGTRLKAALAALLVLLLAGTGAAWYFWPPEETPPPPVFVPPEMPVAKGAKQEPDARRHMVVHGEVINVNTEKPVARAKLAVVMDRARRPGERDLLAIARHELIGVGEADEHGKYRLEVPSGRGAMHAYLLARGRDESVGWYSLYTTGAYQQVELKLEAGQKVRGRLVDASGAPAANVTVRVRGFVRTPTAPKAIWIYESLAADAWVPPAITDANGEFLLTGLVPVCAVHAEINDDRFAPQWLTLKTANSGVGKPEDAGTITLAPARVLEGTVVAADTGEPIPHAHVVVSTQGARAGGKYDVSTRSDDLGRIRVKPYPGASLTISACGAVGSPFLGVYLMPVEWGNANNQSVTIKLPRGVLIKGQVVEAGTPRGIPGTRIEYMPMGAKNPHMATYSSLLPMWRWMDALSDADGRFQIAVMPGPGHLLLRGPEHRFLGIEVGTRELTQGGKGGQPYFLDGLVPLDPDPADPSPTVVAPLRPGVTVRGRVVTAAGDPVQSAFLFSRTYRKFDFRGGLEALPVKDGIFEIPGCDPARRLPICIWDSASREGAVVEVGGAQSDKELTVRLAKSGSASVRFVDGQGKTIPNVSFFVDLVVRPGSDPYDQRANQEPPRLTYPTTFFHRERARQDPKTGIVTIPELIPEATYLIHAPALRVSRTFSVSAGQHVQLDGIVTGAPLKTAR